LGADSGPAIKS